MTTFSWLMFILSGVLLWAARALHRREAAQGHFPPSRLVPPVIAGRPTPATPATPAAPAKRVAAARVEPLEWVTPPKPLSGPVERRARLRDRYIAARFPGVIRGSEDLLAIEYVIKVARHYFEEGRLDDAAELFQLAIDQSPGERALRLAQLEITFLARDASAFKRLAQALREAIPDLPEWDQVARLGQALCANEPLFAGPASGANDGHYGPWPEMPNWIQASWDLTSEVLAADFHRAMRGPNP